MAELEESQESADFVQVFLNKIEKNMEELEEKKKHLQDLKSEKRVIKKYIESLEEKMEDSSSGGDGEKVESDSHDEMEELDELRERLQQLNNNKESLLDECKEMLMHLMRQVVDCKDTRRKDESFENQILTRVWECFVAALLKQRDDLNDIVHVGAANDKGLVVILVGKHSDERSFAVDSVVQVKNTRSFGGGGQTGSAIILQLIGSCVYHGTRKGTLFSSERKVCFTETTRDLLEILSEKRDHTINCYFREDIEGQLPRDPQDVITFLANLRDYVQGLW